MAGYIKHNSKAANILHINVQKIMTLNCILLILNFVLPFIRFSVVPPLFQHLRRLNRFFSTLALGAVLGHPSRRKRFHWHSFSSKNRQAKSRKIALRSAHNDAGDRKSQKQTVYFSNHFVRI